MREDLPYLVAMAFASCWPTSRTGRVEYTTVGKDNFDAFMTLLVKVDFNVWFRAL